MIQSSGTAWVHLLRYLILLEGRQKNTLFQSLLYALCTAYIASLVFPAGVSAQTWNGLLWITLAFNAITALAQSFERERSARYAYWSVLVPPGLLYLAKGSINALMATVLTLLNLALFALFIGWPPVESAGFIVHTLIGALGFAAVLTTTSGLSARSGGNWGLMAVLSLPLLIPGLLIGVKGGERLALGAPALEYSLGSLGLALLSSALGYLLFPYLWRD